MAEGLAKKIEHGLWEVHSAGSRPSGTVQQNAIAVMKEIGIDITSYKSKGFDSLPVKKFDYVVTLGCGDQCPFVPAKERISWDIPDPKDLGEGSFRAVRDLLDQHIRKLAEDIKQRR